MLNLRENIIQFAENTSIHGIPRIVSSTNWQKRLLWTLFSLATFGYMVFQLYTVGIYYSSYPVKTTVKLNFEPLPFPSVTLCNLNPIRKSKVSQYGSDFMKKLIRYYNVRYRPYLPTGNLTSGTLLQNIGQAHVDNTTLKTFFQEELLSMIETNTTVKDDNLAFAPSSYRDSPPHINTEFLLKQIVTKDLSSLTRRVRKELGHQLQHMLVQCYFEGRECSSDVRHMISSDYGNCYTFNSDKYIATRSGPEYGLEIILNLENHDVLGTLNKGYGARLVVHEPGSFPLPAEEGITLSSGYETSLGIKLTKINRLGQPFGHCMEVEKSFKETGMKYTTQVCWLKCKEKMLISHCGCELGHIETEMWHYFGNKLTSEKPDCRCLKNKSRCVQEVNEMLLDGSNPCECNNPCEETAYNVFFSGRLWPSTEYLGELTNSACNHYPDTSCPLFSLPNLRENFLKLNLYYEDLNFESLQEEPLYDTTALLSDIGGSVGLFLGASVLSGCELVELLISCLNVAYIHLKARWKLRRRMSMK